LDEVLAVCVQIACKAMPAQNIILLDELQLRSSASTG